MLNIEQKRHSDVKGLQDNLCCSKCKWRLMLYLKEPALKFDLSILLVQVVNVCHQETDGDVDDVLLLRDWSSSAAVAVVEQIVDELLLFRRATSIRLRS